MGAAVLVAMALFALARYRLRARVAVPILG
jgi:hypothetical protein